VAARSFFSRLQSRRVCLNNVRMITVVVLQTVIAVRDDPRSGQSIFENTTLENILTIGILRWWVSRFKRLRSPIVSRSRQPATVLMTF